MSNRLTFSLASLVLILALGLVFAPMSVMAHVVSPADAEHNPASAPHPAHPILDSVTAMGPGADGFVNSSTSFLVEFKFSGAAPTDFGSDDIDTSVGDIEVNAAIADFSGSGMVYTARLTLPSTAAITVDPTNVTGLYVDDTTNVIVTVDSVEPVPGTTEAKMLVVNGRRPAPPANGQWGPGDFDIEFALSDASSGIDADSIMIEDNPDVLSFSNIGETATPGIYAATVSTNNVNIEAGRSVEITISFSDKAGNEGTTPLTITLAAKTMVEVDDGDDDMDDTGGLDEDDNRNNVTVEAEFALTGSLNADDSVVFSAVGRNYLTGERIISDLPNIQRFFARGGTISVVGGADRSLVISEIMWGLNRAVAPESQANWQWIELYNTDNADTEAAGYEPLDLTDYKLVFTPGGALPSPANLSDQVSNVHLAGWNVEEVGQNGRLVTAGPDASPVDLISMYRNIDYGKVQGTAGDRLNGVPNGKVKGGWKASTVNDTYATNQLGSPGERHFVVRPSPGVTTVPYAPVIINEVGNSSDNNYDWFELRNVSTGEVNLKKWQIGMINAGKDSEITLIEFPDNDNHKIPAGGILLVVAKDPFNDSNHPIAAGTRINGAHLETTGVNSRYYVAGSHDNDKFDDHGFAGENNFLLVVRNRNDRKNSPNDGNIRDLTGARFIADPSAGFSTQIWPLKGTEKGNDNNGHGDVFKDTDENFKSGFVYQRIHATRGTGKHVWNHPAFTGAGYKRWVSTGNAYRGTPGFDNGARKDKATDLAAGTEITISEIMYETGRNLPQWIELYNSSTTQSINLNEWKLKFENADDADIRSPFTTGNLPGVIIPPNQTVLIVSTTSGRHSAGDFPSSRIIDLWSQKDRLEITDRRYQLLSTTAFRITLIQKGGGDVDVAGNMGDDGEAAWELPASEDGASRSSLIRRYGETATGAAGYDSKRNGSLKEGWIFASETDLTFIREATYYGSPDDVATPGFRAGGALPVSLSKFRPERLDTGEIVVRWITESEMNNAGFNILRSEKRDGEFTKLNTKLIAGHGTTSERHTYEYADTSAKPNVVYYYQIQDVSLEGQVNTLATTHLRGNVTAAGKLTTTWGELKALQ